MLILFVAAECPLCVTNDLVAGLFRHSHGETCRDYCVSSA